MKFTDDLQDNVVVFTITGRILGGNDLTMFRGRLQEYANLNKYQIVIDLSGVDRINSVGIGMLTSAYLTTRDSGGKLVLANTTNIESILSMTRLLTIFESFDSVDEAARSLH